MDRVPLQYIPTVVKKEQFKTFFFLVLDSAIYVVGTAEFVRIVLTCSYKPSGYFCFGLRHRGHTSRQRVAFVIFRNPPFCQIFLLVDDVSIFVHPFCHKHWLHVSEMSPPCLVLFVCCNMQWQYKEL